MKALTVQPLMAGSARLDDVDEPPESDGAVLVAGLALGVCGTDIEIVSGAYGWAPPGRDRLVLGHESLGRVLEAPAGAPVAPGDLVVGIVRLPDPVPCGNCAVGEWDFCHNGLYTEHGIKSHDGYGSERWRIHPEYAVKVDPGLGALGVLMEPTSVVAKAWEQVDRIGGRAHWDPQNVVITGAGPIGLLAAMIGMERGLDVHVFDQVTTGTKPDLVAALGATYHTGRIERSCPHPDIVIECTGVASLVFDAMEHLNPGGVACLTGVSSGRHALKVDASMLNRSMVLENQAVVGSVNANHRHYQAAADALDEGRPRLDLQARDEARAPRSLAGRAGPAARRRQGGDRGRRVTTSEIAPGIIEIDTLLGGWDKVTAGYLVYGDAPVLVETGSQSSVGVLLDALDSLGVSPADLAGVAVTHIHLDHAGGVGDVAKAFPAATVYVHEKGARHLVDPTRLIDSAARCLRVAPRLALRPSRRHARRADPRARRRRGDPGVTRPRRSRPWTHPGMPNIISPCTTRRAASSSPGTRWGCGSLTPGCFGPRRRRPTSTSTRRCTRCTVSRRAVPPASPWRTTGCWPSPSPCWPRRRTP